MSRRMSNSSRTLPVIPEYPDFQDIKDLERTRHTSSAVQNRSRGWSDDHFTDCQAYHHFSDDKTLQDYFNERLSKLRNYESKTSTGKMKNLRKENQTPINSNRRSRHQSRCSTMIKASHIKLTGECCGSTNQVNESMGASGDQGYVPKVEDCCKRDYLECLTMTIRAPLEMFLKRK